MSPVVLCRNGHLKHRGVRGGRLTHLCPYGLGSQASPFPTLPVVGSPQEPRWRMESGSRRPAARSSANITEPPSHHLAGAVALRAQNSHFSLLSPSSQRLLGQGPELTCMKLQRGAHSWGTASAGWIRRGPEKRPAHSTRTPSPAPVLY